MHESVEGVEGPGKEAQLVKCFLCKHENLCFDPRCTHKEPGGMVCTCNLSAGEVEMGASLGLARQSGCAKTSELQVQ